MGKFSKRLIQGIERRDSLANPTWLANVFGGGSQTASGIAVTQDGHSALREATLFSCVKLISGILGSLPLPVFARTADGGKVRAPSHPLYKILDKSANPQTTAMAWREQAIASLLLAGNSYSWIERDNAARVRGLWPLPTSNTKMQVTPEGKTVYLTVKNNQQLTLPAEDVLHVFGLSPDGRTGYSPVALLREHVATSLALQEYGARYFSAGMGPNLLVKSAGNLSPEQKSALRTTLEERANLTAAHRVMVVEAGMSVERMSAPNNEAQWLEAKRYSRSEIAAALNVPLFLLGEVEKGASFASVESQMIAFQTLCLGPLAARIASAMNAKLFSESEQDKFFCEFVLAGILKGDAMSRFSAYHLARQDGWLSVNDIRDLESMNRVTGGDVYLQPLNMTPVGTDLSTPDEAPSPSDPGTAMRSRRSLIQSQRAIFAAEAERILKRERADVSREAEKRALTIDWLQDFYAGHRQFAERQMLPALRSYAELIATDIERELGRRVPAVSDEFISKFAESFGRRHSDASLALLRDQSGPALERAFGPSSRRSEAIASHEAVKAGNAFASYLYREVDVATAVVGTDDCDRRIVGKHPPLKVGCTCVVVAAGRTATRVEAQTVQASADLQAALDIARSATERPINVTVTTPPLTIEPGAVQVNSPITVQGPGATKYKYDRDGRLSETTPVSS